MPKNRVLVLVRDAMDGRILIQPPQEQRWLLRMVSGRAASIEEQEWVVEKQIDGGFFEELERSCKWTVAFSEHFDIIVWDREAGLPFAHVYATVFKVSTLKPIDQHSPLADTHPPDAVQSPSLPRSCRHLRFLLLLY